MRVLHVTDDLVGTSGVRTYLEELRVTFAGSEAELRISDLGSGSHRLSFISRWFSLRHLRAMEVLLERERPDLVHAHNLWMVLSPSPLLVAHRLGIPVAMTVHDFHLVCPRKWMITPMDRPCERGFGSLCLVSNCRGRPEGWCSLPYNAMRWLKVALHRRLLVSWVDLFICPSHALGRWMRGSLDVANVEVVHNFVRAPEPPPGPPEADPPRLLFAGRLSPEKGAAILIRALPPVLEAHPGTVLTVAGDGPERSSVEALARELGVGRAVRFVGTLGPDGLADLYRQATAFVLPTLWMENCPVAVLEAMAHGRPVVATRIGGIPELVEDGVTGLLVSRADPSELARRIKELLSKPAHLVDMGDAAAARHRRMFCPERHTERLLGLYRSLLRSRVGT